MLGRIVSTAANFIPARWAPYGIAVAAIVASWPLAYHMWGRAMPQSMMHARPIGA